MTIFKHFRLWGALAAALAALAPAPLRAQSQTTGAIAGAVTDAQHASVIAATVTATNLGTNATYTVKTDATGRYLLTNLQPGNYSVAVAASGFSGFEQGQVQVEVGLATTADAALAVAGQNQTVSVTGEAPVLDTEQSQISANFNSDDLQNLPINARRWSYFALATPGAVADGTYGDIAYRGLGYMFDNNTVDGASNTEAFFAEENGRTRMAYSTSLDAIQEFQVSTSNYSAEYGRAVGGVVDAVTKSGTNQLHGDLFYFNRDNTIGGAYNPFATGAVETSPGNYTTEAIKPLDIRQQFGGGAGGALIQNKLFWYFDLDAQLHNFPLTDIPSSPSNFFAPIVVATPASCTGATLSGSAAPKTLTPGQILACRGFTQSEVNAAVAFVGSTTGQAPRTGNQTIAFPKIDWTPNGANTVTVSYNRARWFSPYGVQTSSVEARGLDSDGNDYVHDDRAVASWQSVLSPAMINQLRFISSRDLEFEFNTPALPGEPVSSVTGFSPQVDINGCGPSVSCGWTFGAPYYLPRPAYPNEQRFEGSDSLTWSAGNHTVKFGVNLSHAGDNLVSYASGDQYGEFSYSYYQDFLSDYMAVADNVNGGKACTSASGGSTYNIPCYNDYLQTFGPLGFNTATFDTAAFVQDDWHVKRNLTLNLGLRYDREGLPAPVVPNPAVPQTTAFPTDNKDFAPRLGFNYQLTPGTVLRGGAGLYYGLISNEQIYEEMTLTGSANGQLSPTIYPTTGTSNSTGTPTPGEPIYPQILASYNASVGTPNIVYFPKDLHLPGAEEFDLTLERQLSRNTAASVAYLGSYGMFLPVGLDTNLPQPGTITYTVSGGPLNGQTVQEPFFSGPRPNSAYQRMTEFCTCAWSHYNAVVAQINRRMTDGLQFNLSYTYSSTTDDGTADSPAITSSSVANPFNLGLDEGTSSLQVQNRLIGTAVWRPSYFANSGALTRGALQGWLVSINETAQSGTPYSPSISGNEPSGLNATVSSGGPTGGSTSSRALFVPKNSYFLPGLYNTDMRLSRSFQLRENLRFEFTAEGFNLLNHQSYSAESTASYTTGGTAAAPTLTYNPSFGTLTNSDNSVFSGPRQLQFGARITF